MAMSATSLRRLPLGCLGVTFMVWSKLVTAMTLWPRALAASARPTIEPFTPEFDAIMKMSLGWMSNSARRLSKNTEAV